MGYTSTREVVLKSTFIPQTLLTMAINFGINFGLAWATYSNWGKRGHDYGTWPTIAVWTWSYEVGSCIAFDLVLTSTLMGFFCTLLATGGAQKDVKDKKVDVIDPALLDSGWWRWTPARVRGLCLRSLAQGLYWTALGYLPTIAILSIAIRGGTMPGLAYVIFKGIWAFFLAGPMFSVVYFSALDKRHFPDLEFEPFVRLATDKGGSDDAPPLVGQVGHI